MCTCLCRCCVRAVLCDEVDAVHGGPHEDGGQSNEGSGEHGGLAVAIARSLTIHDSDASGEQQRGEDGMGICHSLWCGMRRL